MQNRLAVALSSTALVVALLGTTGIGEAAVKAIHAKARVKTNGRLIALVRRLSERE